tara:strand:+ start:674 stop:1201 length:528 start_codon:yes stop_codon:yes gene_type:complete
MAVPSSGNELSMNKIARERKGFGYNSSSNVTSPIFMSDISRLSGGNSSGSGTSYPAVNMNNIALHRPDGANPLQFSEFYSYEQNLTRTGFHYIYSASSSSDACLSGLPAFNAYYHTDGNNLFPDNLTGIYTAYTTQTGTTTAASGFYQLFDSNFNSTGKFIQVGSNGAIIGGGNC